MSKCLECFCKTSLVVIETVAVHNPRNYRNVEGNKIKFTYPHASFDTDFSNERFVKLVPQELGLKKFGVEFNFKSKSLRKKGIDGIIEFDFLSEDQINEYLERQVLPSKEMLIEFLLKLGFNWSVFLRDYLAVEIRYLRSFICSDIGATLKEDLFHWSPEIRLKLERIIQARNFIEVSNSSDLVQTLLKNYQTSDELLRAKTEIIEILEEAGILSRLQRIQRDLRRDSREILAAALMYVPMDALRVAMFNANIQGRLFALTPSIDKFISDGRIAEGEEL